MRRFRLVMALVTALALCACGGSTSPDTDGGASDGSVADGARDAAPADAGSGADACPPGTPTIPDAAIYACEAGAPADAGCPAAPGDPNASRNPNVYPRGCVVTLPTAAGFCSDRCCGPLTCNCEAFPGGPSAAQFVCPL